MICSSLPCPPNWTCAKPLASCRKNTYFLASHLCSVTCEQGKGFFHLSGSSQGLTCFLGQGEGRCGLGGCEKSPVASSWNERASATGHLAAFEGQREKRKRYERQKGTDKAYYQQLQFLPPVPPPHTLKAKKPSQFTTDNSWEKATGSERPAGSRVTS